MKHINHESEMILEPGSHFIETEIISATTIDKLNKENPIDAQMPKGYDIEEVVGVDIVQQEDERTVFVYLDCYLINTEYVVINTKKRDLGRLATRDEIIKAQNTTEYKKRIRTLS